MIETSTQQNGGSEMFNLSEEMKGRAELAARQIGDRSELEIPESGGWVLVKVDSDEYRRRDADLAVITIPVRLINSAGQLEEFAVCSS